MPDYTAVGVTPPRSSKARPPQFGSDLKDEALQHLGSTLSGIGQQLAAQQQKNAEFDTDTRWLQLKQQWLQHYDQITHGPNAQVNPVVDPVPPSSLTGQRGPQSRWGIQAPVPATDIGGDSMGKKRFPDQPQTKTLVGVINPDGSMGQKWVDPSKAQPIPPPLVPSQQSQPFNLRPWGGGDAP